MELYTLDANLNRNAIISNYKSYIWTERFRDIGEFEIVFPDDDLAGGQASLSEGTLVINSETDEPMEVETIERSIDEEGTAIITVSGRSLVNWLELRVSTRYADSGRRTSSFAASVIDRAAVSITGVDDIPDLSITNLATDTATFDFEAVDGTLYDDVKNLLDDIDAGLKVVMSKTSPKFRMYIYTGVNRPIVFSRRNGTLVSSSFLRSKKKHRNVCFVWYKWTTTDSAGKPVETVDYRRVYGNGGSASRSGIAMRACSIDATGINRADYPGTRFNNLLDRMGKAELAKWKYTKAVDGEIPDEQVYPYRKSYFLGDAVSFEDAYHVKSSVRVVEYIWSLDENGFKSYPTFDPIE